MVRADPHSALTIDPAFEVAQMLAPLVAAHHSRARSLGESEQPPPLQLPVSLRDSLTGLPNRLLMQERLQHAASRARRTHAAAAALVVDLDGLEDVTERHGHEIGDQLLVAVAARISQLVQPGDTVARVSGDTFELLCEDLGSERDAQPIATLISEALEEPFVVGTLRVLITATVEIAYAGPGVDIGDRLATGSGTAPDQAERADAHDRIVDLRDVLRRKQLDLEADLHAAMADGAFAIAYQPIVRSADGLVTGVEALLRWTHPELGPISPLVAIGIAEQSGLINDIGRWMLERSSNDRAHWLHDFPERPLDLSVNVSGGQLLSTGFCDLVEDTLATTGMDPSALVLELTENILIEDSDRSMTVLSRLKALGVRLALDDFGTGFSSLSYLRRLPVDIVKIDQMFVSDVAERAQSGAIVKAVTDLTHALGLTVIAEGIETEAQRARITDLGCDSSQGYFYARPMSASALGDHLATATSRPLFLPAQRTALHRTHAARR